MLYKIVEQILAHEPRIKFNIPDGKGERNWYGILREGDYSALMIHGDQIRGHSGFPWYGLGKKVNGWASGAIREPFKDVFMGHWHQNAVIPLNDRDVYVNGSTESYNTYAIENLAAIGRPSQRLLFVSPEKGSVTAQYKVNLTEEFAA
jgi:DNA repair exonuclease SbcCD nuclease subunit